MSEHTIQFGTQTPAGLTNVRQLKQSDIGRCPFYIMAIEHYRTDGSCKCSNAEHRAMMIKQWGYRPAQFKNIKLKD